MYREKIRVMPSEAGCTNEIKIRALLNRFQDTAALAVEDSEGSTAELMRRGYGWVLLRYQIEVERRLPALDETAGIETRHTLNDGFHTLRVFRVFADKNESETLVAAKTSWVLLDLAAGRPVRAAQRLPEIFVDVADDPPIDPDFTPIRKLSQTDGPVLRENNFEVRFHDLDPNSHVNNAVYFEWMYESTPLDLTAWTPQTINAEFRVSAKLGDTVTVRVKQDFQWAAATVFNYEMLKGDKTLARFQAVWKVIA